MKVVQHDVPAGPRRYPERNNPDCGWFEELVMEWCGEDFAALLARQDGEGVSRETTVEEHK